MSNYQPGRMELIEEDEFGTVYKYRPARYRFIGPTRPTERQRGVVTHCAACGRRLRNWHVRAADDPRGVQRGDARRCVGCKFGNKEEALTVDELNENDTQWVKNNVPSDLHWYFGVTND